MASELISTADLSGVFRSSSGQMAAIRISTTIEAASASPPTPERRVVGVMENLAPAGAGSLTPPLSKSVFFKKERCPPFWGLTVCP